MITLLNVPAEQGRAQPTHWNSETIRHETGIVVPDFLDCTPHYDHNEKLTISCNYQDFWIRLERVDTGPLDMWAALGGIANTSQWTSDLAADVDGLRIEWNVVPQSFFKYEQGGARRLCAFGTETVERMAQTTIDCILATQPSYRGHRLLHATINDTRLDPEYQSESEEALNMRSRIVSLFLISEMWLY